MPDPADPEAPAAPEAASRLADGDASHACVPVRIEEALGAAAMALICLISFGNVIVRYATSASFGFTEEYSVFLLVFMTFVGASAAFAAGDHIRITFLTDRLPPRVRRLCDMASLAACVLMFGLIAWYGGRVTYAEWYWGETTPGTGSPAWLYTIWMPLLSVAIIGRILGRGWATLVRRAP